MIDPGYIVIGIFVGIAALIFWSRRASMKRITRDGASTRMPGTRLEGSDHVGGAD